MVQARHRQKRRCFLLTAVSCLALAVPACSPGSSTKTEVGGGSSTTAHGQAPIVREIARIPAADASWVDISGQRLTWTTASQPGGRHDEVVVYDLTTKQQQIAARPGTRGGVTDWSRISDTTVAYTDQAADLNADNSTGHSPWRIMVLNLSTGKSQVVDQDRSVAEQAFVPTVELHLPWVAWLRPTGRPNHYDLMVLNLETNQRRTVAADGDIFDIGLTSSSVTYSLPASEQGGRNLFVAELVSGSSPKQLTTTGAVTEGGKHGGRVAVYAEAKAGTGAVYVVPLAGGPPQLLSDAVSEAPNPVGSEAFAAWWNGSGDVQVGSFTSGRPVTTVGPKGYSHVPSRITADGDLVVWGEVKDINQPDAAELVVSKVAVG
ncbi:MAG: hypothetical protein QOF60_3098 [Actinomycetota bacterium]|jgi:hypothetical protein|nr:hypothetical protein [Actinomycetota bacterium]